MRWQLRYRDDADKQRKESFVKKSDAVDALARHRADLARGMWVDPSDRTTLSEYAKRWASARPHRPTTARRVASTIDTHIVPMAIGSRRLAAVLPSDVQGWASDRAQVLPPSTLRKLVSLLRSIYASAVLDRLVGAGRW
jgi:hypothetical protein